MAWVRPSRSKPRRSRPGQGRFNCGESGEACGWVPSSGGPEPVGAAGVRGRDGHGTGGGRYGPLKQVSPVARFCSVVGRRLSLGTTPSGPTICEIETVRLFAAHYAAAVSTDQKFYSI
jgi:hypothetical protein